MLDTYADVNDLVEDFDYKPSISVRQGVENLLHGIKNILKNKKNTNNGGAGFIGSAVIRNIIGNTNHDIVNVDKLTYAGNLESLASLRGTIDTFLSKLTFVMLERFTVCLGSPTDIVMHLGVPESHVDRSINSPDEFIKTNIIGTYTLLEQARYYWSSLMGNNKANFRFHHISTDEVYGDLDSTKIFLPRKHLCAQLTLIPLVRRAQIIWCVPGSPYLQSSNTHNELFE